MGAPLLALALLIAGAFAPARAQTRFVEIGENRVGTVKITQGKSQSLRTSRSFVDLVVGDPEVADVMPLTDQTLYVLGKKIGTTNISVFDQAKELVGVIEVEVTYNTPRIAAEVAGTGTKVATSNGRTVVSGVVPDAVAAARSVAIAKHHGPEVVNDLKIRSPQQVMLEVRFVEASRNAGREFGVNWETVGKNYGDPTRAAFNVAAITGTGGLVSGNTPFGSLVGRVLSNGVEADILIQALEDKGLARRLAEPNLIAMSGEKASFLAGGEFPFPVQGDNGRITIEFKKYGVGLVFTPTVLGHGVINLRVEPEVSQIDTTTVIRTATVTVPGLIVRRASTVVELKDGQSFAIAGLLQSITAEQAQQLPWLGDLPVIGTLFRSAAFEKKETDLVIIVTPRLVRPARPGERLRTPLDSTQPANDADRFLLGRNEVPVAEAKRAGTAPFVGAGHILELR